MGATNKPEGTLSVADMIAGLKAAGPGTEVEEFAEKRRQEKLEEQRAEVAENAGADDATLDREYTHNPSEAATDSEPDASPQEVGASAGENAVEAAAATNDRDAVAGHAKLVRPAQGMQTAGARYRMHFYIPDDWFRARADLQDTLRLDVGIPFTWEVEEAIENLSSLKKQGAIIKACEEAGLPSGRKRYQFASAAPEMGQYAMRLSAADNKKVLAFLKANKGLSKANLGMLIIRNILVKYGYMTEDGQIADPYPELQFET